MSYIPLKQNFLQDVIQTQTLLLRQVWTCVTISFILLADSQLLAKQKEM